MRLVTAIFVLLGVSQCVFGQNDRGVITGQVRDQGGAVVPNAQVVATNKGTGAEYRTTTTDTGNYTIPSLFVGVYTLSVEVQGFKKFTAEDIPIQVAVTNRIDVSLQVGTTAESVTVTAETAALKTESAEQSTVISTERINALPLNFGGGGGSNGNIRSTFAFNMLSPGVTGTGQDTAAINGLPTGTFRVQIEGQDATSQNDPNWTSTVSHASVDSVEEFSLQTSNFAAEFGQVGGGFYNFTTKSGTNQYHGGGYEYLTNEAFNAYRPYFTPSVPATSPRSRKHDFGGTFGGPVWIPKIYDGKNKSFFFVSEEVFRNVTFPNGSNFLTLPTAAMRGGDFSDISLFPAQNLGTDPNTGVAILNGAIYDPASRKTNPNGSFSTFPFVGNKFPVTRFDPVAAKIQGLIPAVTNANPTANFVQLKPNPNNQQAFTIKVDQVLPDNSKLSFYFNKLTTNQLTANDSLPYPISGVRVQAIYGTIPRLNYDKSLTPTMLLHLGIGYQRFHNPDSSPSDVLDYDTVGQLGFVGSATSPAGFPRISGLPTGYGPSNANKYYDGTFTAVASGTWVHGNHTYKLGGEWRLNSWTDKNSRGSQGFLQFNPAETGDPFNSTNSFSAGGTSGSIGNAYASFLLGLLDGPGGSGGFGGNTTYVNSVADPQLRKQAWGLYIQDTWKITRKLTLDYGLRWDLEEYGHEIHDRWVEFGPNTPNPVTNNLRGALVFEGNGPGRCNCTFSHNYPFAIGPRVGAAYTLTEKTVLRAGIGVSYAPTQAFAYITNNALLGVGFNHIEFPSPSFGVPAATLAGGLNYNRALLSDVSLNPGIFSNVNGTPSSPNFFIDPNANRPARILQWSAGLQREVVRDLVVEANYVANQGVWENNSALLGGLNTPNSKDFAKYGIDPTTSAGQATLSAQLGSSLGTASGVPRPYPTFPLSQTVLQALRPFPQISGTVNVFGAPLGKSWYNSLQVKVTKRYSHGLSLSSAFTWSKTESNPAGPFNLPTNDIFNRPNQKGINGNDIPFIFNTGVSYEVPQFKGIENKYLRYAVSGWNIGGLFLYAAGSPIPVPQSSNNHSSWYGQNTRENRVPGEPLFISNPNCHCIDPTTQFTLNPAAWVNPPLGQFGNSAAYYTDFRNQRRPAESINIGRTFRIGERVSFQIRAEYFNALNRLELNGPTATGPQGARTCSAPGKGSVTVAAGTFTCPAGFTSPSGFGAISYTGLAAQPRNGQIVARVTF